MGQRQQQLVRIKTSQCVEAPVSPQWMKTKAVALCGHSNYQPQVALRLVSLT